MTHESGRTANPRTPEVNNEELENRSEPEAKLPTDAPARIAGERSIQRGHQEMIERQRRDIRHFVKASEAVSALEYALLVGIITVALGAAITQFGGQIAQTITDIGADVITRGNLVTQTTAPAPPSTP